MSRVEDDDNDFSFNFGDYGLQQKTNLSFFVTWIGDSPEFLKKIERYWIKFTFIALGEYGLNYFRSVFSSVVSLFNPNLSRNLIENLFLIVMQLILCTCKSYIALTIFLISDETSP